MRSRVRLNDNRRMLLRMSALFVWALAAASAAFWGIRAFSAGKPVPANATMAAVEAIPNGGPLNKVLGATLVARAAEPVDEDPRFKLLGVVAPKLRDTRGGVALISVNDQPARPFRVGATIDGDSVLLAVARRSAEIGPVGGPAEVQLDLPDPDNAPRPAFQAPNGSTRPMSPGTALQPPAQPPAGHILPVRPPLQAPSAMQNGQTPDSVSEDEDE